MKRVFLIVLDSCGVGELPDAPKFGDYGVNTLRSCASSKKFSVPNLLKAGLGNIDGVDFLPKEPHPNGAVCKLAEKESTKEMVSDISHQLKTPVAAIRQTPRACAPAAPPS